LLTLPTHQYLEEEDFSSIEEIFHRTVFSERDVYARTTA
jgi:hypothetical protein